MKTKYQIGQTVEFLSSPFGPYKKIKITKINKYHIIGYINKKRYVIGRDLIKN